MLRYQHSNALGSPLASDRCQERAIGIWDQRVLGCWDQDWLERRARKASDRAQDRKPRPFEIHIYVLGLMACDYPYRPARTSEEVSDLML
jgi:hypothetical protein